MKRGSRSWWAAPRPPLTPAPETSRSGRLRALFPAARSRDGRSRRWDRRSYLVDRGGQLQDLLGQLDQLLVLGLLGLNDLPLVVGQHLPFLVRSVLADHHER